MKFAVIEDGHVVNVAVANSPLSESWVPAGSAGIGDRWDGVDFYAPPVSELSRHELQMKGVEFNGVLCSATKNDADGLTSVGYVMDRERAAGRLFSTPFEFENGAVLLITPDSFDALYDVWMPFRQSFFALS